VFGSANVWQISQPNMPHCTARELAVEVIQTTNAVAKKERTSKLQTKENGQVNFKPNQIDLGKTLPSRSI
jgi:hypothetical protein